MLLTTALMPASAVAATVTAPVAAVVTAVRRICALAPEGVSSLWKASAISGCPVIVSAARNRTFWSFQPTVLKASVSATAATSLVAVVLLVASIVAVFEAVTDTPPAPVVTVLSTILASAAPSTLLVAMMPPSARLFVCVCVPAPGVPVPGGVVPVPVLAGAVFL
ncbi:hypothetical protein CHKEEEPN_1634 [Methylorubrum podarium]|nr:hypothetical protein CHKEEEPN_1634 [Methylorubrum podarium]